MRALLIFLTTFFPVLIWAQVGDTTLQSRLAAGKFSAHARTFYMSTVNKNELTDYYAWAIGAGVAYESPEIRHFRIEISGFFIYNLASSDLSKPDPVTNGLNRYEIGLFDITDPNNDRDLDRLEELFLQYRIHKSFIRAGKVVLNTPFINPQDGRMRPTLEQGLFMEINEIDNVRIEGGYISRISPRSTVKWYSVGESIGIYPQGLSVSGSRSDYGGYSMSDGVFLLGATLKRRTVLSVWNTFIENISNTALVQAEREFPGIHLYAGLQYVRQDAVGEGGNADEAHRYMVSDTHSNIISVRVGHMRKNIDVNLNATIIDGNGRYLMPREWGRDPFYTFLPRERVEGVGGMKAASTNIIFTFPKTRMRSSLGIGYYDFPDVKNYRLNKYAMPSFAQLNADLRYNSSGYFEGVTLQFLYVYKLGIGDDYENPRNTINKVNMGNLNLVLNYKFGTNLKRTQDKEATARH